MAQGAKSVLEAVEAMSTVLSELDRSEKETNNGNGHHL